jgi:arabinosyltransferase C
MSQGEWIVVFLVAIGAITLAADADPTWNLIFSWAVIGMVAIYFPGLFQRKLTMGLSVPWAILSACLMERLLADSERYRRNLFTALALVVIGASSLRWLFRDLYFINHNVSNTTMHPVFLSPDEQRALAYLDKLQGRHVLLAVPGVWSPTTDPDAFETPIVPDLGVICSGLTGVYTYAGHWSETPDYKQKRAEETRFFLVDDPASQTRGMSDQERSDFVAETGADYALMPSRASVKGLVDPAKLGDLVFAGSQFSLVKLRKP